MWKAVVKHDRGSSVRGRQAEAEYADSELREDYEVLATGWN
jgi:hypothetical protein